MKLKDSPIWKRFEAVAAIAEDKGEEISVCDNCEVTYPYEWVIENKCPFCGKEHTSLDDITIKTRKLRGNIATRWQAYVSTETFTC